MTLTDEQLGQIKARLEAATPGPWRWRGKSGSLHGPGTPPYEFGKRVLSPTYEYDSGVDIEVSDEDSAFIISAPTDIRALLTEVRRLQEIESEYAALVDIG